MNFDALVVSGKGTRLGVVIQDYNGSICAGESKLVPNYLQTNVVKVLTFRWVIQLAHQL